MYAVRLSSVKRPSTVYRILILLLFSVSGYSQTDSSIFQETQPSAYPDFSKAIDISELIELYKRGEVRLSTEATSPVKLEILDITYQDEIIDYQIFLEYKGVLYSMAEGKLWGPFTFLPSYQAIYYIKAEGKDCITFVKFDAKKGLDAYHQNCIN